MTRCPNCGAPLKSHICDYCEVPEDVKAKRMIDAVLRALVTPKEYQRIVKSEPPSSLLPGGVLYYNPARKG